MSTASTAGTTPASPAGAPATGQFYVQNGQFIDPNGSVFVASGFNMGPDQMAAVSANIDRLFPGTNFIRFATDFAGDANPVSSYVNFANQMAAKGIVVEFEDHPWPLEAPKTGGALQTELSRYNELATALKGQPYAWFGSMNEPQTPYGAAEAAISTQDKAIYDTIRATGNNTIILMEAGVGAGNPGTIGAGFGMDPNAFAGMHNVGWDEHFYGWVTGGNTSQAAADSSLNGSASGGYGVAAAQTITSGDGIMPVIIGEFGDSSDGQTIDANGEQVVHAVTSSPYGFAAWHWNANGAADVLTNGDTSLTSYGQEIAQAIAARAAARGEGGGGGGGGGGPQEITVTSGGSLTDAAGNVWTLPGGNVTENGNAVPGGNGTQAFAILDNKYYGQDANTGSWYTYSTQTQAWTPSAAPVFQTQSPNFTIVLPGSSGAILDASGNKWTITGGGQVAVNGKADTTTAKVGELAYVNRTIWQQNSTGLWRGETAPNGSWTPSAGTTTSPLPVPAKAASLSGSVILGGSNAALIDAAHNAWTITAAGKVALNGVVDATTANVSEIAYVKGQIWQENAANLWWSKASPTAAWGPNAGTSTSPLAATPVAVPAPKPDATTLSIPAAQASTTVSQSNISVLATAGDHMVFVTGSADTLMLSGGKATITDTGKANTYAIPAAGKGFLAFTSNILPGTDTLDLRPALAGTQWNGSAASIGAFLHVTDTSAGATLSVSATANGGMVGVASFADASTAKLKTILAHAIN